MSTASRLTWNLCDLPPCTHAVVAVTRGLVVNTQVVCCAQWSACSSVNAACMAHCIVTLTKDFVKLDAPRPKGAHKPGQAAAGEASCTQVCASMTSGNIKIVVSMQLLLQMR